jgi:hypothetical protein
MKILRKYMFYALLLFKSRIPVTKADTKLNQEYQKADSKFKPVEVLLNKSNKNNYCQKLCFAFL